MAEFLNSIAEFLAGLIADLGQQNASAVAQVVLIAGLYIVFLVRSAYKANLDALEAGLQEFSDRAPKRSALSDRQNQLRLRGFARYQSNVQDLLNSMATFVGDAHDEPADRVDTEPGDGRAKAIPFWNASAQSYLFAIGLATLYPLLSMLAVWAFTGQGGEVGAFVILPNSTAETRWGAVIFEAVAVTIVVVLLWYSFPIKRRDRLAQWAFAVFAILTLWFLMAGPEWPWWTLIPAFIGALFAQGPLAAAMAWFVAIAVLAIAFFGGHNTAFVVATLLPLVAVWAYRVVRSYDGKGVVKYALVALAMGLSLLVASFFAQVLSAERGGAPLAAFGITLHGLVVLLCVLPLANAFFDWISLSVTRSLMSGVVAYESRHPVLDVAVAVGLLIADIIVALALSIGVTFTALGLLNWFFGVAPPNGAATASLIPGLVEELQSDPLGFANIWIYAMLYSTLVPTIAHLVVGVYAIAQSIPLIDFEDLEKRLGTDSHHTDRRRSMARELTFLQVADDLIAATLFWVFIAVLLYLLVTFAPVELLNGAIQSFVTWITSPPA